MRYLEVFLEIVNGGFPPVLWKKQRVAGAKSSVGLRARALFLSGFARLLQCRKNLG
ncbi:hypothetical protein [Yoonia sp.]|uniref:hypothetical protein n=1 Tax=Yoonia sp. TaxID=2212373 RepID=UPI0025D74021|nr:hypothetical protein [Yoonia sp.]